MEADLSGNVAVVTGAGRGLGRAVAVALAREGTKVVLVARSRDELAATAATIGSELGETLVVPTDVTVPAEVEQLKVQTEAHFGRASILVNAAGVFGPVAEIRDSDPIAWVKTLMVNAVGPYLTCRVFVGGMLDNGWGRIVNVSSASSLNDPIPLISAYATAKVALNRMTRHLAAEIAGSGVTANVIHPGDLKTEMWADISRQLRDRDVKASPLEDWVDLVGRTGGDSLSDAVDLVLRLVGRGSGNVNGQFCWPEHGREAPVPSW